MVVLSSQKCWISRFQPVRNVCFFDKNLITAPNAKHQIYLFDRYLSEKQYDIFLSFATSFLKHIYINVRPAAITVIKYSTVGDGMIMRIIKVKKFALIRGQLYTAECDRGENNISYGSRPGVRLIQTGWKGISWICKKG